MPVLATLEEEFADENLAVVTICIGSSAKEVSEALQEANTDVLVLMDESGKTESPYQVGGVPVTYLIDGDGVVQTSNFGYGDDTEKYLRAEIERLLEK